MDIYPISIEYQKNNKLLIIIFNNQIKYDLSAEYLRVFSPSAEVQGHGRSEPVLVPGKINVAIESIEPIGQYAVRLCFDDGHNTGLYSWEVLRALGEKQDENWQTYLNRLQVAHLSRDSLPAPVIAPKSCGNHTK